MSSNLVKCCFEVWNEEAFISLLNASITVISNFLADIPTHAFSWNTSVRQPLRAPSCLQVVCLGYARHISCTIGSKGRRQHQAANNPKCPELLPWDLQSPCLGCLHFSSEYSLCVFFGFRTNYQSLVSCVLCLKTASFNCGPRCPNRKQWT